MDKAALRTRNSRRGVSEQSATARECFLNGLSTRHHPGEVYAAILIGVIVVKVRHSQVARTIYAAVGLSLDARRDVSGLWAGTAGEGATL
ncbi:hypothetical protein BH683_023035 [Williamsia sp. 1138]|nr:hypothetical protein BH683_023035 [Williamsia sp. 1138]